MSRQNLLALCLALGLTSSACSPQLFRDVASVAIFTAAVVGTAHMMADHDAHFHDHWCGHHRRWYHGHWVYHYDDRWEYYDPNEEVWYYYDD